MELESSKLFHHAHGEGINVGISSDKTEIVLHVQTPERMAEFQEALRRSLSTWEPHKYPQWIVDIMDRLTGTPPQPKRGVPTRVMAGFEQGAHSGNANEGHTQPHSGEST